MATQEMTDDELTARHPSIPIGSKAKVTNIANGKEVEVTIVIPRISPSATRVVDLSPGAAMALDIGFGGPVIISQILPVQAPSAPESSPPPVQGRIPLTQRGMATQEMTGSLFAAHPILPIGSIVKVTNRANDKEVRVIITDRIPPSDTRVIDLSPGAASALDIGKGGPVIIEVLSMP
jgi:rare lipoprotein A (peptidoglycan hydrolase)